MHVVHEHANLLELGTSHHALWGPVALVFAVAPPALPHFPVPSLAEEVLAGPVVATVALLERITVRLEAIDLLLGSLP